MNLVAELVLRVMYGLLLLLLSLNCVAYARVQDLNDGDFDSIVGSDNNVWIIKFTAPVCMPRDQASSEHNQR